MSFINGDPSTVLITGAGNIAARYAEMLGEDYSHLGLKVFGYDNDPSKLDPETGSMNPAYRLQYEAGRIALIDSLDTLDQTPDVIIIATSSGHHTEALETVLDTYEDTPKAVLIEKPLDPDFDRLMALFGENGHLTQEQVFVNEHYLVSEALEFAHCLIELELGNDNQINKVVVSFDKNRVPDVLSKRFTDPELGAYGIEIPHILAVGLDLLGIDSSELAVLENRYGRNVDGVKHSEYTYTRMQTCDGAELVLAQGLGPFRMDENGVRTPFDFTKEQRAIRRANVEFADGRQIMINFDPVSGIERYATKVEWIDPNGNLQSEVFPDGIKSGMPGVIGKVLDYASTGERPRSSSGLSVVSGIQRAIQAATLRANATEIDYLSVV